MIDFCVNAITAPFVPLTQRCFDRITRFIIRKHPEAETALVNHDIKVIAYNFLSIALVSAAAIAYVVKVALVTMVVVTALLYLLRWTIALTIVLVRPSQVQEMKTTTLAMIDEKTAPTLQDRVQELHRDGDELRLGRGLGFKLTYYPFSTVLRMFFTRS